MEKKLFFKPDRFGRNSRFNGSAEDSSGQDWAESFRMVASSNKAAEEGMKG
jgi:hypothetical protein